mmetsp:Transcript_22414/g.66450  ORF Transcript_22414/g.66450 Transcript_22414/m.66450 type:complete len:578 (+) Transcript_22414:252-1985(+)
MIDAPHRNQRHHEHHEHRSHFLSSSSPPHHIPLTLFHAILHVLQYILHEPIHHPRHIHHLRPIHLGERLLAQLTQALREPLQHLLVVLKPLPPHGFLAPRTGAGRRVRHVLAHPRGLRQVERKAVSILQHAAALHQLLVGRLEELHVRPGRVGRLLLQQHHALLRLAELPPGELLRLGVGVEALVVVQVSVQLALGLGRLGLIALVPVDGVELVAAVVAPRVGPVIGPVPHADPAELVLALLAVHVVAPLVLLDPTGTLGARLGVGQYPVGRLRLVPALLVPADEVAARDGGVRLLPAPEAERCRAGVALGVTHGVPEQSAASRPDGDALASRAGAPARQAVPLHEAPELEALEAREEVRGHLPHLLLGHELVAPGLGALGPDGRRTIRQRHLQESPPAVEAEIVAAGHAHHLVRAEPVLVVADLALPLRRGRRGGRDAGAGHPSRLGRSLGRRLFGPPANIVLSAPSLHPAALQHLIRVLIERLKEPLLGPLVLAHEHCRRGRGNAQDLRHLPKSPLHYRDELGRVHHADARPRICASVSLFVAPQVNVAVGVGTMQWGSSDGNGSGMKHKIHSDT